MTDSEETDIIGNHEEEILEEENAEIRGIQKLTQRIKGYLRERKKYLIIGGLAVGIPAAAGGIYGLYDWATPERPAVVQEIKEPYGKVLDVDYIRINEELELVGSYPEKSSVEIHAHFGNEKYLVIAPIKSIDDESKIGELYNDTVRVEENFIRFGKISIDDQEASKVSDSDLNELREFGVTLEPGNGETIIYVHNSDVIKWIRTYTDGRPDYLPRCCSGR